MTARKHHYIPQCYLKGFARHADRPQLFVIDFKSRNSFRASTEKIAAKRDFHTIEAEGVAPDEFENKLSGFETELSQALEKISRARSIMSFDERALLFNLVALLAVKNPSHRESFRLAHEQMMKRILLLATATRERWEAQIRHMKADGSIESDSNPDYEEMRKFVERDAYSIHLRPGRHLQLEMGVYDKILPLIFNRKWVLLRAPSSGTGFLTSDHPVCISWSDPARRSQWHGPGLGSPRSELLFPITNDLAMIGAFEVKENERDADERLIAQVNGCIIAHAERQIYARDKDFIYRMTHNTRIKRGTELLREAALARTSTPKPS